MKEAFEKIIDELKQESIIVDDDAGHRAVEIIEQIAEEYNNGWIPCSVRLPEEHDSIFAKLKGTDKWYDAMFEKISDDVNVTVEFEDGTRKTMTLHTNDGKWNTGNRIAKFNVIAWQPLPECWKGENNG